MHWFVAPLIEIPETTITRPVECIITPEDEGDTEEYTIDRYCGPAIGGVPAVIAGSKNCAFDAAGARVLTGVISDIATPEGWIPQTLSEAKLFFESIEGRPPSDQEVY